jgi:leucyl aminopeptidase
VAPVQIEATTAGPLATDADTIVVGVFADEGVAHDTEGGALQALLDSGEARREFKRLAVAHAEGRRFILVGLGDRPEFDPERARVAAAIAHARACELATRTLCWELPHHVEPQVAAALVEGTLLHGYRFTRYRPPERPDEPHEINRLLISAHHDVAEPVADAGIIARAQNDARDLGNTPANDLTPTALAEYAERLAEQIEGLTVTVLDGRAIRDAGMGALAAVSQGSAQEPRVIRLQYDGATSQTPRLGLVGKAVTFDSGGLSIKPAAGMANMKFDMCGGAAVIEAIGALARLRAPVNVLAVLGATENLPSGTAVKPGDIVRALDGTTIEVNNTDAEGRLVLADCLSYARSEGCDRLLDVATLTGGIVVALGSVYAGLMSNDDEFAALVEEAGRRSGELVWRLPLHSRYAEMVKGRYAQLTNLTERREASSITAAEFLHHFAGSTPWAHLDIAGTADNGHLPYLDRGGTGFGVRLLVEVARSLAQNP